MSTSVQAGARGTGPHAHLCCSYGHPRDLRRPVLGFIEDGLARGLRVEYVAQAGMEELRGTLAGLADLDGLIDRGALRLTPLDAVYDAADTLVPERQVAAYAAATDGAIADGYAGYRAAAVATPLVRTPEQREIFCRYEHLVDRYMTRRPFSAMCAYDRVALGAAAVEEVACLHPACHGHEAAFALHAGADGTLVLRGEVDIASARIFVAALERATDPLDGGELVVDASGLEFIDHRGLAELDRWARIRRGTLVLRGGPSSLGDLVRILGLRAVRTERAA